MERIEQKVQSDFQKPFSAIKRKTSPAEKGELFIDSFLFIKLTVSSD